MAALSGCAGTSSIFNPASVNAQEISSLIQTIYIIAAIVFVIVEGLLIYAAIRFSRKSAPPASEIEGNVKIEIGWTLLPAIVLAIVFFVSLKTLSSVAYLPPVSASDPPGQQPVTVRVVGHQWWWEFDYPDLKITTADELHVPVNTVVYLEVTSNDVIHSYWVPQLGGKIDAIPGQTNHTWFKVTQTGTFDGQCAEFCGVEHGDMRLKVVAESADQFQTWVKDQQSPIPSLSGEAAKGEQYFLQGACVGCHTIDGTAAQGKVGPNLTHIAARSIIAGGVLTNTPENLTKWLTDPQAVKPGNIMPNLHLPADEIQALVAFLGSLK